MIYSGATREHLCDRLSPGCFYRLRVYCISDGGQSAVILAERFFFFFKFSQMRSPDAASNIKMYLCMYESNLCDPGG